MEEITLKQMQEIELNLFLEFKKICEKHSLRYYIDGGTLLGAYCYGGFIPWDDDIDIKMPRPDYEKLINYRNEFSSYIKLVSPQDDNYSYTFTKIIDNRTLLIENPNSKNEHIGGVYIDILPMDGYPKDSINIRKIERYKTLFHLSKNGFPKTLKGRIYSILYTPKSVYKRLTSLLKSFKYDESEYAGLLIDGDLDKEKYLRDSLNKSVLLNFEGYDVPASSDYEKHLSCFYGEHVLKPECKNNLPKYENKHLYKAYWRDDQNGI